MSSTTLRTATHDGISAEEIEYAPGARMGRHAHAELSITIVLRGGIQESVSHRADDAVPLSIGIKPAGVEHANEFSPRGTRTVAVKVTDAARQRLDDRLSDVEDWRWIRGGPAVRAFLGIADALRAQHSPEAWLALATADLLAGLRTDARLRPAAPAPAWLRRLREHLIEDAAAGVPASRLAREAGLHPVSLARAFRRQFGESMSDCVRRARLQAAVRALEHDGTSLADAAAVAGLADQSHLTRLCRAELGRTPAALRRLQATA